MEFEGFFNEVGPYVNGAFIMWVLSLGLRALPKPKEDAGYFYIWLHTFAALLGANLDRSGVGLWKPTAEREPKY